MSQEIELKFLVKGDFKPFVTKKLEITQAYLSTQRSRTVRIRIQDGKGYINIKGAAKNSGIMRYEWEQEILSEDAGDLMKLRESGLVEKTRYIVPAENDLKFEIDEFHGDNEGLLMAEIELPLADTFLRNRIGWVKKLPETPLFIVPNFRKIPIGIGETSINLGPT